jgi:hypothetical protein
LGTGNQLADLFLAFPAERTNAGDILIVLDKIVAHSYFSPPSFLTLDKTLSNNAILAGFHRAHEIIALCVGLHLFHRFSGVLDKMELRSWRMRRFSRAWISISWPAPDNHPWAGGS